MRLLLDIHLLPWTTGQQKQLSAAARRLIVNRRNTLYFSTVSLWEIAIKRALM